MNRAPAEAEGNTNIAAGAILDKQSNGGSNLVLEVLKNLFTENKRDKMMMIFNRKSVCSRRITIVPEEWE